MGVSSKDSSHAFFSCFKSQSTADSVLRTGVLAPIGNTQVGSKLANLCCCRKNIFSIITGDCNHAKVKSRRNREADILEM